MGRDGLYYRATLPSFTGSRRHSSPPAPSPQSSQALPETHAPLKEIESADISQIVDSSSRELLDELNRKRAKMRLWPSMAIASTIMISMSFFMGWSTWLIFMLAVAGAIATYIAYTRDALEKTVVLFYDFDAELEDAYAQLLNAANQLADSAATWHIEASGEVYDRKYHAGASNIIRRKHTFIHKSEPPYVKTNIETISIGVGRQTLHFFPDRVLVYDADGVGAVSYPDLRIAVNETRFIETDPIPRDAEIVDRTWRYVNKSGGPDRRFKNNKELPICRYEEITLSSQTGLNEILQLSRCGSGSNFASAISQLGKAMPKEANQLIISLPPNSSHKETQ